MYDKKIIFAKTMFNKALWGGGGGWQSFSKYVAEKYNIISINYSLPPSSEILLVVHETHGATLSAVTLENFLFSSTLPPFTFSPDF